MNNAIETHGLTRRFGKNAAVNRLTLSVPEGSIFAFLGPNGAGKTTTIKMLLNILRPTEGSAGVLGVESTRLGPREFRQIGYVSENQQMPEWMTVAELIDYCRPMYPQWDPALCARLLDGFELPRDGRLKSLSRGMRMKAALLVSLAYRPRLLVLDEPFTGLDPLVRDEVIRGMLELTEQENWTVLISSHDIDEVERLADWVGVIDRGEVQLAEPTAQLQTRFRRLDCTFGRDAGLPASVPQSWLLPEINGRGFSVVDSDYRPRESEALVARTLPGVEQIAAREMSLREVFLALARTYRFKS